MDDSIATGEEINRRMNWVQTARSKISLFERTSQYALQSILG